MLESLLEENLSSFEVLVKIAQGDESEHAKEYIDDLKERLIIRSDEKLPPGLADVLLSALKISPDGPVLVNPFYFDHPDEIGLLERAKQKGIQSLLKKLRENESDGEEKTRDRK
jgi:hypothetical protein